MTSQFDSEIESFFDEASWNDTAEEFQDLLAKYDSQSSTDDINMVIDTLNNESTMAVDGNSADPGLLLPFNKSIMRNETSNSHLPAENALGNNTDIPTVYTPGVLESFNSALYISPVEYQMLRTNTIAAIMDPVSDNPFNFSDIAVDELLTFDTPSQSSTAHLNHLGGLFAMDDSVERVKAIPCQNFSSIQVGQLNTRFEKLSLDASGTISQPPNANNSLRGTTSAGLALRVTKR